MYKIDKVIYKQLACTSLEEYKNTLQDICNNGIDSGFTGFIYYNENVQFFKKNKKMIVSFLEEEAINIGYSCILTLIKDRKQLEDYTFSDIAKVIYSNSEEPIIINWIVWLFVQNYCYYHSEL